MSDVILRAACCLCDRPFGEKDKVFQCEKRLAFTVCPECGVPSRTDPADISGLYDDSYSGSITGGFRSEGSCEHARFTLRILRRFLPKPGRILDVGCAGGEFLAVARTAGWDISGVELQRRSALLARDKGITVYSPTIDHVPPHERFDVVTLLDVWEHIHEPRPFLDRLCRHMKPGGLLYLETPNYASMFRHALGRKWMGFIPHHEILYSPPALASLLSGAGFHLKYQRTYGCSLLSYDGLRRMRIHEPAYNLFVLALAGLRKLHLAHTIESCAARLVVRRISRTINWPFEKVLGEAMGVGDQLITVAQATLQKPELPPQQAKCSVRAAARR